MTEVVRHAAIRSGVTHIRFDAAPFKIAGRDALQQTHVCARAEPFARARYNNNADVVILFSFSHGCAVARVHRGGPGVELLGPIERNRGDVVADLVKNFLGHDKTSSGVASRDRKRAVSHFAKIEIKTCTFYNRTNMSANRLQRVLDAIDDANREDPNREEWQGEWVSKEWLYGRRMSEWLHRLAPEAPETLQIAARGQHIRRWEVPRDTYPEGRAGYHQWRTYLYGYHGDRIAELMEAAGYDSESVERVRFLLKKKKLKTDPDTQALEDAACLVFLENHLADFLAKADYPEEKFVDIVRKTWAKMSENGRAAALELRLPEDAARIVHAAVADA